MPANAPPRPASDRADVPKPAHTAGRMTRRFPSVLALFLCCLPGCRQWLLPMESDRVAALGTPAKVLRWAKAQTDTAELSLAFPALIELMTRPGQSAAGADAYVELSRWVEARYVAGDISLPKDRLRLALLTAYGVAADVGVPKRRRVPAEFATLLDRIEPADEGLHVEWQRRETHRYNVRAQAGER